ncbi:MAG: hypothetical protein Q7Q71_06480 [Verrucomicrobiota bacterium JB023]|nr:hypothetical protein [Verrucomicrobiota bacterium JB023]
MRLREIVFCYPSRSFRGSRTDFEDLVERFEIKANPFERDWRRKDKSSDRIEFKKGRGVSLTFDYSNSNLEVQVIFEFDEQKNEIVISAGNWGFPFEPLLSKKRYLKLLDSIEFFLAHSEAKTA